MDTIFADCLCAGVWLVFLWMGELRRDLNSPCLQLIFKDICFVVCGAQGVTYLFIRSPFPLRTPRIYSLKISFDSGINDFKVEVAKEYATQAHIIRLETKLDDLLKLSWAIKNDQNSRHQKQ